MTLKFDDLLRLVERFIPNIVYVRLFSMQFMCESICFRLFALENSHKTSIVISNDSNSNSGSDSDSGSDTDSDNASDSDSDTDGHNDSHWIL